MGLFQSKPSSESGSLTAPTEADLEQARRLRQEAFQLKDQARDYSQQSQAAYLAGNGAEAKRLSGMKNDTHARADALHAQAEKALFAFYNHPSRFGAHSNSNAGEKLIDFHELLQNEVLSRLNRMKEDAGGEDGAETKWVVIVGRGNHSKNHPGQSVLKGTVEKWCEDQNLSYRVDEPNVGCVTIILADTEEKCNICCTML